MPANMFYAEEGSVWISGLETHTTGSVMDFSAEVKEISITGGGRDVEAVRCFGNYSYFDEKPMEPIECSLTVIKKDADFAGIMLEGTDTSDPRAWTGDTTPRKQNRLLVFRWNDMTNSNGPALRITMASVFAVSKELSLNATDHLEETVNFKCLPKNYKEEATLYATGSPLP